MTHIDDLPVDIWPNIFKNLSINDLFNCRLVNKKFKDFSHFSNSIYRLFVGKYSIKFTRWHWYDRWNYNNELIEKKDTISFKCFQLIKSSTLFNLDNNLKYLEIDNLNRLKLEELSSLNNLEYLNVREYKINDDQYLNLLNLKHLKIGDCKFKLNINTPKLEIIEVRNMDSINFESNPESVKHLIITHLDSRSRIFKNLEILEFFYSWEPIFNLSSFDKLKQVKITTNNIRDHILIAIFNNIKAINKNIDFYLVGIKILDQSMIANVGTFKYKMKNYDLLDLNQRQESMYFRELDSSYVNLRNDLPSTFFDKFSNLSRIYGEDSKNGDNLNWFLRNLKNRSILLIISDSYNQDFYNNLPNTIEKLKIEKESNLNLNYDFLFELKNLRWFKTEQTIDLFELALDLFLNHKYLEYFDFKFGKKSIRIVRLDKKFRLYKGFRTIDEDLNYDGLVKLCDKIRN